jgi:ParB/RepB/Spo0J family partition protein
MAKRVKAEPGKTLTVPGKPGKLVHVDPRTLVMTEQVRTESDEKADAGLYESIKLQGVRDPIEARMVDGKLHVIAGHRRTTQAILAEIATVPVYVVEIDADYVPVAQLTENIQRLDMSLKDVSAAVWSIYTTVALCSAKSVAATLGKTKSWVSKMLTIGDAKMSAFNTVARSLLAQDKITDLEIAYMLCMLEQLDKEAAQLAGANIENETRSTIKARITKAKLQHPETVSSESGEGDPIEPTEDTPIFSRDTLSFMKRVIEAATVNGADMDRKVRALTAISEALQGE